LDLICDLLGTGSLAAKIDGDIRAMLRQHHGHGRADAARRARDQSRSAEKSIQIARSATIVPCYVPQGRTARKIYDFDAEIMWKSQRPAEPRLQHR
jgi:hypothetical protein